MQWLLNHGADASTQTGKRWTALYMAARSMDLKAVQVLLEHNLDVNSRDCFGATPFSNVFTNADSSQEAKKDAA
jgi:ankyrin repeat protein